MNAETICQQFPELDQGDVPYLIARFMKGFALEKKGKEFCWNWAGSRDEKGYGMFRISPLKTFRAHRFSFLIFIGALNKEQIICHRCDNPACVNPSHLFQGTHQDNVTDCINKNRRANLSGPSHGNAKLDWPDIERIRRIHLEGVPQRQIATEYGVSQSCVWNIVKEITWANKEPAQ